MHREIIYVFGCTSLLSEFRQTCSRLTVHDEYPYAALLGLLITYVYDPSLMLNTNVQLQIAAYLDNNHQDDAIIKKEIVEKSLIVYVALYDEIKNLNAKYKTIYIRTVDPFLAVGIVY